MKLTGVFIPVLFFFSSSILGAQSPLAHWLERLDALYGEYVHGGDVDYEGLSKHPAQLYEPDAIMRNMSSLSEAEEKAFLINAYNFIVIREIVSRWPVESVWDIPGFFDRVAHDIGPYTLSLDALESLLFKRYPDARMHLVLICGAETCPPFFPQAYRPGRLDVQLDTACRRALQDPVFLRKTSGGYRISRIFEWYRGDFGGRNGVREFIRTYRPGLEGALQSLTYYPYDWSVNQADQSSMLRLYTPSFLLSPGQYSLKWFHNVYTQTTYFDAVGHRIETGERSTFYTVILELYYGLSKRWNLGLDGYFKSVHYAAEDRSPLTVFSLGNSGTRKTAFTHLGPSVKVQPVRGIPHLSAELTWLFPLGSGLDEAPYLEADGHQALLRVFYDRSVGAGSQLFVELGFWTRFDEGFDLSGSSLQIPLKVFGNFFINDWWTIYLSNEFNPRPSGGRLFHSYFLQSGLGMKFLLVDRLEVELLYTDFWLGKNAGAGQTFNLGFRYLSK